jgi:hypothetical protein
MNITGTQLADLVAYPIARFAVNPNKTNLSYKVISRKFYRGKGQIRGLKIFP